MSGINHLKKPNIHSSGSLSGRWHFERPQLRLNFIKAMFELLYDHDDEIIVEI
jgi:hypothetical protein